MNKQRWSWAAAAALALGLGGACSKEVQTDNRVDATYQAIAGQFRACATDAMACLKAANCDEAQNQVCRDQFATCREAAQAAADAFHAAVRECRAEARACKGDAGDADDGGARRACFDGLKMCVADARPEQEPPSPCFAALRECLQADDADSRACMMTAHQCFVDSLPPRCDGDGGVLDGGWDFGGHRGDRGDGDHGDRDGRFGGSHRGGRDCPDRPDASSTDAGTAAGTGP